MVSRSRRLHPERIRRTLGAARCVRERARFVVNELRDTPTVGQYRLRGSGLLALVRHPLLDMWGLEEVFRFRAYEPPRALAGALASLPRPLRILDLGGHAGYFGLFILGLFPDCRITSFEPDPDNARILRRCVAANAFGDRWQVIEAAGATSDGTAEFCSSFHLSRVAHSPDPYLQELQRRLGGVFPFLRGTALLGAEGLLVQCRDVLPLLGDADLIKLDIEGGEWEILGDPRFREAGVGAIVLEYHPAYGPGEDAEATVARALTGAGLERTAPVRGAD
ncbi:MAG: FkbM family methyltransferase, partial [Solirubrobacterales bacterium]|nr:FkbM family methyltransferase [Solirubrobacterales bacterium]